MTWIRRTPTKTPVRHTCSPPTTTDHAPDGTSPDFLFLYEVPAGGEGSLWRCDDCGNLWRVGRWYSEGCLRWLPAWWWQRWRYRRGSRG